MEEAPFLPEHFGRLDEEPDGLFYTMPRKVVHIDETATAAVQQFFRDTLPTDGVILDLFSSWRSHWPAELPKKRLVGIGLNAEEMADNPDLDEYIVQDVNADPRLPFADNTFDAVVITVSIQYVTQPLAVFQEVRRILRPGAPFAVLFSNRMFPTKAIALWRSMDDRQHIDLVASYFHYASGFEDMKAYNRTPSFALTYSDPLYVVMARKAAALP
jgi:SAM-dependent methyltransferase